MSILVLILILLALGYSAYFVNTSQKLSPGFKQGIYVVLVLIAVISALVAFGLWDQIKGAKVPTLK